MSETNQRVGKRHRVVRRVRALRRDGSLRRSEGVYVAEGVHLAQEVLGAGAAIEFAVVAPRLEEMEEGRALLAALHERGLSVLETPDPVLDSLQDAHSPQPVLVLAKRPEPVLETILATTEGPPLIVVAHGLQDPGNLGNIIRSADAAGATACVVSGDSVDPFHPRAVRGSMGAIVRMPVLIETSTLLLDTLRRHGIVSLAAEPSSRVDYLDSDLTRPVALFLGREGRGLPSKLLVSLDETVRIPMQQGVNSLSVGAAAAVLLFEAVRQRR